MNTAIRRILTSTRLSRRVYFAAREIYGINRTARAARGYFLNTHDFKNALSTRSGKAALVDLRTADGLTITIRQNYGDAMTVAEVFLGNSYVRGLTLPADPVVIDIGGFVGDFSLYAVKHLNARKVVVCEPSPHNWTLLLKNIANNGYEDRIVPVNKAVTDGRDLMMNIDAPEESQCMVSGYYPTEQRLSTVPGVSLAALLRDHRIDRVDLLKIDCEGGEFEILESTPTDVFRIIRNLVFEYHQIDGVWSKLESVRQRLRREGYTLQTRGGLVVASRP